MARCGIASLDDLLDGRSQASIGPGATDQEAVAEIQDFLRCQGYAGLPGLIGPGRGGSFGPKTCEAVREFRSARNLGSEESVDSATLRALVEAPAAKPLASRSYLSLVLGIEPRGMAWVVALTSHFESARSFSAMCLNKDRAGLSFGLIQWAQKPGRLHEILKAFDDVDHDRFVSVFGAGNQEHASGLLAHTAKPNGGVDPATGATTDTQYDLVAPEWVERFSAASLDRDLQRTQCDTAIRAFSGCRERLSKSALLIRSERGVAFLMDLANQHGEGGARSIYSAVVKPGIDEAELLEAMANESIRRVGAQFGEGTVFVKSTVDRRTFFRTTALLSDGEFAEPRVT